MSGIKRRASIFFTLIILCAVLIWNIIHIGIFLLNNNNAPIDAEDSMVSVLGQNQHLVLNDIQLESIKSTDSVGIVIINQSDVKIAENFIISSFFIYFIIATNVSDYNLFPSQEKLVQSTRQKIYNIIEKNEGIHLREICRMMDKKMGVVQYHLYILENANLISSMKDGRYKRFFINHQDSIEERILISFLKRETTAKVLIFIYQHNVQGISHSTIAKNLKATSQAITWHIHKLENAEIITTIKRGCRKFYQISQNFLPVLESLLEKNS